MSRVLVNGSEGIGTGWSSTVPNYNPRQIISNIRRLIEGEAPQVMTPFYDGFVGDIIPEFTKREGSFQVLGKIERLDETTLYISELPIKKWTQDYKLFLESMMNGDPAKKIESEIKDFKENHTDTTVAFTIICSKENIDKFEADPKGLYGKFKLTGAISTSNMNLFDADGRIAKYNSPEDILIEFFQMRLSFYAKRKELLLQKLIWEQTMLRNKARFIDEVCSGDLIVSNRKRADILADLQMRGYDMLYKEDDKKEASDEEVDDENEQLSDAVLAKGYEYLLGMKIWSLTFERAEELRRQLAEKENEVKILEATSPSQIWMKDLDDIEVALDDRAFVMEAAAKEEAKAQKKAQKVQAGRNKKFAKKGKKKAFDSDEESDMDERSIEEEEFSTQKQQRAKPPGEGIIKKNPILKVAPKPAAKPAPVPSMQRNDIEHTSHMKSLADTMQAKLLVSPPSKRPNLKSKSSFESDDSDEFNIRAEDFEPASVTPVKPKAVAKKAPTKATTKVAPKKAPAPKVAAKKVAEKAKPMPKKAAPRKKILELSDSEEEGIELSLSDTSSKKSEVQIVVPARSIPSRSRAAVTYNLDDTDDDEDSDF
jgi:DNA topoisomerase II